MSPFNIPSLPNNPSQLLPLGQQDTNQEDFKAEFKRVLDTLPHISLLNKIEDNNNKQIILGIDASKSSLLDHDTLSAFKRVIDNHCQQSISIRIFPDSLDDSTLRALEPVVAHYRQHGVRMFIDSSDKADFIHSLYNELRDIKFGINIQGDNIHDGKMKAFVCLINISKPEYLSLNSNQITDSGIEMLCNALTTNNNIKHLSLRGNPYTPKSLPSLIKAIENKPITYLSLRASTDFHYSAALLDALNGKTSIDIGQLDLSNIPLTSQALQALNTLIDSHPRIKYINLDNCFIANFKENRVQEENSNAILAKVLKHNFPKSQHDNQTIEKMLQSSSFSQVSNMLQPFNPNPINIA